jgi:hypothetical protein
MVEGGDGVGQAVGKGMLRRQAVVHRDDAAAGLVAQTPAQPIMGFQAAGHPAAAVKEQDAGQRARRLAQRRIDPEGHMPVMNRHQVIAGASDRLGAGRVGQVG